MSDPGTDPEIILPLFNAPAVPPSHRLVVKSHGASDWGMVRKDNEDDFLIADLRRTLVVRQAKVPQNQSRVSNDGGHLFIVADGMGGHKAGELASLFAVGAVQSFLLNTFRGATERMSADKQSVLSHFEAALQFADARLVEEGANHPEWGGMGTTLTLAFVIGRKLFVAHAGDSRCYLLRDGSLVQITHDHSFVGELLRNGMITPEQAFDHPYRHIITNFVGGPQDGLRVELHEGEVQPGDVLLLCTDGLTTMLPDDPIADILRNHTDPRVACERLVMKANGRGGKDNITVVVAAFAAT